MDEVYEVRVETLILRALRNGDEEYDLNEKYAITYFDGIEYNNDAFSTGVEVYEKENVYEGRVFAIWDYAEGYYDLLTNADNILEAMAMDIMEYIGEGNGTN